MNRAKYMNIETDFFDEESYTANNKQLLDDGVLYNQEKALILIENVLESGRLRKLITTFKDLDLKEREK